MASEIHFLREAARIPFLLRWPGHVPAKQVSDVLLGTPDIMPTLLSLLKLPTPRSVEGMDLSRFRPGGAVAFRREQGTYAGHGRDCGLGRWYRIESTARQTSTRMRLIIATAANFCSTTGVIHIS